MLRRIIYLMRRVRNSLDIFNGNYLVILKLRIKGVIIQGNCKNITIDESARIEKGALISTEYGGSIFIGKNTLIRRYAIVASYGGNIEIGKNCIINHFDILYGHGDLRIGDDVMFAAHTVVVPASHGFDDLTIPISRQPLTKKGINIGNNVWIGTGVSILDGVEIGEGSVVGAGSVVTKNIPEYSVAYGVPAKVFSNRKENHG